MTGMTEAIEDELRVLNRVEAVRPNTVTAGIEAFDPLFERLTKCVERAQAIAKRLNYDNSRDRESSINPRTTTVGKVAPSSFTNMLRDRHAAFARTIDQLDRVLNEAEASL